MAGKAEIPSDSDSIESRVAWLLHHVWKGSQTAMGRDIGLRPGSISNVITGKRTAGRSIITAISSHPLVNPAWLMHGLGAPLRSNESYDSSEAALPIAAAPFCGSPSDNPDLLEDGLYPAPKRLARPSRYWVRMTAKHPLVHDEQLRIREDDMVLFEPLRDNWPKSLRGKPCLLSANTDTSSQLYFARSNVASPHKQSHLNTNVEPPEIKNSPDYHKLLRNVQLDKENPRPVDLPVIVEAVGIYRCGSL